ncbi:hypothetical protein ABMA27_006060 [Loxostege sticticalis]|uniref:Integrase catalytic domain-containing protein n=1 Tax=Loxostege sticticalis TaxID=481309 RepID=A0ABR3HHG0_LOXSC
MIDRATRWPEAVPVSEITAQTVAKVFVTTWISRFGCPATISTDQGRQFESDLFISLNKLLGIKKIRTTSYHPQANGMIERWHRTMKSAIIARGNSTQWSTELPIVLLGLRAAIRADDNVSPAQMLYGTNIRIPGVFFEPKKLDKSPESYTSDLIRAMENATPLKCDHHGKHRSYIHPDMASCDYVFVRTDAVKKPLTPPYEGPYRVLEKQTKFYKLEVKNKTAVISVDRLKPAFILRNDEVYDPLTCVKNETAPSEITSKPGQMKSMDKNASATKTRSGRIVRPVVRFAL